MVAAVYGAMTIQAPPVKGPVIQSDIYGLTRFTWTAGVDLISAPFGVATDLPVAGRW
jgi:hypothetical protein